MSDIKIMVTKMPSSGKECPFSEYSYRWNRCCTLDAEQHGPCRLDNNQECEYLADLFKPINYDIDFDKLADKMTRVNVISKEDLQTALKIAEEKTNGNK